MHLTNYHSHTLYCDGRSDMETFIRCARSQGFTSYGISSHAPLPFATPWTMEWENLPCYLDEIARLKQKYAGQIELLAGLEIDYLDKNHGPSLGVFQALPLDYRIGSVHMIRTMDGELIDIDGSAQQFAELVDQKCGKDLDYVVCQYFTSSLRMLQEGGFDIIGHACKIEQNAGSYQADLFDKSWYQTMVHRFFETAVRANYIIEINTKSYEQEGIFYPHQRYFPFLKSIGARIQVNSDAHHPFQLNNGRQAAFRALKEAGFQQTTIWSEGGWKEVPIEI